MRDLEPKTGVIRFARTLPRRHRLAVGVTAAVAVIVVGLDTVALTLVVPTVQFLTSTGVDASGDEALGWLRPIFEAVGIPYTLTWTVSLVLLATVARAAFMFIQGWLGALFAARYEADLKIGAYSAIMGAGWPFFLRQRSGDIANTIMVECSRSGVAFSNLSNAAGTLLNILVYVGIALVVSWELTLGTIAVVSLAWGMFALLARVSRRLGERTAEANSDFATEISEGIAGAKIIKSEAIWEPVVKRFADVANRRARLDILLGTTRGGFVAVAELAFLAFLLGSLLLATRVFDLPTGKVMLFVLVFIRMYQRIRMLQSSMLEMNRHLPALDVVQRLTTDAETNVEALDGEHFDNLRRGIEFEKVSFAYENGKPVLRDVSLNISAGSMVALAGRSGAGKTSIIDLTIGLLQPDKGRVLVDGEPLESYDEKAWRSRLAYVSQETILFHDSVYGNIAWGREDVTEADVFQAARLAQADEFIREMPNGYGTVIGDRGMRLSGGQRQRLALARALLRKPELLILDEATSELDSDAEARVQAALEDIRGRTTILVAAHRLSTITSADRIYVLERGEIIESGTAGELFASEGAFHRSYQGSPRRGEVDPDENDGGEGPGGNGIADPGA